MSLLICIKSIPENPVKHIEKSFISSNGKLQGKGEQRKCSDGSMNFLSCKHLSIHHSVTKSPLGISINSDFGRL